MTKKHFHAMNGSFGCLPDSNEVFSSKKDAIEFLAELFWETRGVKSDLQKYQYCERNLSGADYCEVTECNEPDCLDN